MNLSDEEKKYLWRKVEFSAKKKMKDNKDDKDSKYGMLYDLFNGTKKTFTSEEAKLMLSKLENRFKHALDGSRKPMKSEIFLSIMDKLPSGWSATTKYSNLDAKRKADKKKINESMESFGSTSEPIIEINKKYPDERSPLKKKDIYEVNYQINFDWVLVEITGDLVEYHGNFEFEPDYFTDTESEDYYDVNYETIEKQIVDKLYSSDILEKKSKVMESKVLGFNDFITKIYKA